MHARHRASEFLPEERGADLHRQKDFVTHAFTVPRSGTAIRDFTNSLASQPPGVFLCQTLEKSVIVAGARLTAYRFPKRLKDHWQTADRRILIAAAEMLTSRHRTTE